MAPSSPPTIENGPGGPPWATRGDDRQADALAAKHGRECADVFHVLNGPNGKESAQRYLNPDDATHSYQSGHDKVTEILVDLGFRPLVTAN